MAIQLMKPLIHEDTIEEVGAVLRSGWLGLGPRVKEFEEKFCSLVEAKYAIAFNSGTEALRAAVVIANFPKGSCVITTPNTFLSTNHVLLQHGLIPIFADINPTTGSIDPASIERILKIEPIGQMVKGLMIVHYAGQPADLDLIYDIASKFRLTVIEDAAHACGAIFDGRPIGCDNSTYCCFSFHAVKNLALGDGGMLTTNDGSIAELAKKLRWMGIDKSTEARFGGKSYSWDYDCNHLGFKSHMNDIMATIGLGQMKHLKQDNLRRQELVDIYKQYLPVDIKPLSMRTGIEVISSNHLMVGLCSNTKVREIARAALDEKEIQWGLHYKPNYMYPMYQNFLRENNCECTRMFYETAITLPLHLYMTDQDVMDVCETIWIAFSDAENKGEL